jgi:acyl carrier protein
MNNEKDKTTEQQLDDILVECLGVKAEQLTPEARFMDDLGADSLTITEIIMAVEERFGITVSDEQAERAQTVGQLRELLEELLMPR